MLKLINYSTILLLLYSCSPINKQHGYLLDDLLISSEKISNFELNVTSRDEIYNTLGSPSIEIDDVDFVWIYLLSLKEKKVFEEDTLLFQNILRFAFNDEGKLIDQTALTADNYNKISFSCKI